jgi:BirA family biotin operon repressor/biotin-[acetyl-CoA-carboxylase] ligase
MGFQLQVKWPNDLVVQGAKVGGVLGEGVYQSGRYSLILGVGLNSNIPVDGLPRLEEGQATSLRVLCGEPVDNEVLLQHLLRELDDLYALFRSGGDQELLRQYRQFCSTIGRKVEARTPKGRLVGTALDISRDGLLILEDEDGEIHELADATVRPVE